MGVPRIDLYFERFLPDLGPVANGGFLLCHRPAAHTVAFSSEVETGSREENASKQQSKPALIQSEPISFRQGTKALRLDGLNRRGLDRRNIH
jgi:hypothetical protein